MEEKSLESKEKEGDRMEDYVAKEGLEEVEEQACDLSQVEKDLEESTKVLVEDFTKRHLDATMTMTGLQLVQDTREACSRGDPQACKRLELIRDFLERIHPKEGAK